jgi:protease I
VSHNRLVTAIGHGVQVLTAAGLARGRNLTGHVHVAGEVEHAGGVYVEKPVVRDGRLITARDWQCHPEFYHEVFACLNDSPRA